jgi:hypothetical protein
MTGYQWLLVAKSRVIGSLLVICNVRSHLRGSDEYLTRCNVYYLLLFINDTVHSFEKKKKLYIKATSERQYNLKCEMRLGFGKYLCKLDIYYNSFLKDKTITLLIATSVSL